MDKKVAEEEALKKAKDAQAAAGKNSGMSGRDLVSLSAVNFFQYRCLTSNFQVHIQSRVVRRLGGRRGGLGSCKVSQRKRGGGLGPRRRKNTKSQFTRRRSPWCDRRLIRPSQSCYNQCVCYVPADDYLHHFIVIKSSSAII